MNETRQLAGFIAGLRYEHLPASVVARTKELILDQLGIEIGVSAKPWLKIAHDYIMKQGGRPEATVVNYGSQTTVENAAFVNATFGHGFEMDDVYSPALAHPGPVIVPAALALGEREGISGKALILAVAAGYEVMGRAGHALSPTQLYRGFHPTSAAGPVGAAAAAGKILGFDQEQMLHALAISASFSSGLTECYKSGGEVKRYHAGIAASGGLRGAGLAALGLTGPATVLEGPLGIRAMSDSFTPEVLLAGLGERYVVSDIWQKKYACNGMIHAPADAIEAIRAARDIDPDEIEEVLVGSNVHAVNEVGSIKEPKDIFGFQFSLYYALGMYLAKGSLGFGDFVEENLADPSIISLSRRVRVEKDDQIDRLFPDKIGARVTIRMKSGASYSETVEDCRGTPLNPMEREERENKVRGVAGLTLQDARIDQIIDRIDNLEELDGLHRLTPLLIA